MICVLMAEPEMSPCVDHHERTFRIKIASIERLGTNNSEIQ